ncbi:transmembrane protein UsgS, putative [Coccidioides posadasii C735 delta SOWgp]|uniref:Transmembrane protein UsgS, putative n=1 Tax=Coccidioides posadasii (strain C735) TaxID=222929 RepID=C5PCA8_COCP7|nr:transmembrane protein UsgS, putative [Coccidioides posadasii C735 delta SOWgp]EER25585.1 transmembrane protein UsgS, putative [Coccidioides posadasii C735 delta SOWgp]|eukprot:XP_003067730.1 transmembrane protein UsgS, putative [Coccidioides posadasii C735 delta SOWgp]
MSNFEPNAILRGAQLTLVGAHRALQNPELFTSEHYRQAALAVVAGIAIRLIVSIPVKEPRLPYYKARIAAVRLTIWMASWIIDLQSVTWDDTLINGLDFIARYVLQVPFLLMTLMRYITPTLDNVFMESIKWVDSTYVQKHKSDDPAGLRAMYYPNLVMYSNKRKKQIGDVASSLRSFFTRYGRRTGISLAVYLLSLLPVVGRFVIPLASFYTFNKAVGPVPATVIFGSGLVLPKRYLVVFLQSYFASRSLMRELLEPYFSRVKFTKQQRRKWFLDREGVLFGFALGFYTMIKIPLIGVLIYGLAEASTAYLVTKITDPPPPPADSEGFVESQIQWTNKHRFLRLPLGSLDQYNVPPDDENEKNKQEMPQKKFS